MSFKTFNLADVYGAADRANAQRDAQQYQQYQIQRQMRDDQRSDAVRGAYKIGPNGQLDETSTLAALYGIDPQSALQFQTSQTAAKAAAAKAKGEETKLGLENKTATAKYLRDAGAGVTDQATYDAWRKEAKSLGAQFVDSLPDEYDPNIVRNQLLTADKFLEQSTPKYERVDLGGKVQVIDVNPFTNPAIKGTQYDKTLTPGEVLTDDRTRSEGRLNRGVTMRGQNMTDARSREANASGKPPSGYRFKEDGTLEAIQGGPGDKRLNPTESQGKASLYSTRAAEADAILNDLGDNYSRVGVAAKNSGITDWVPGSSTAINALSSDNTQSADQAQRNFINAVLRQESGAAISASEFDNARKQYFPQPGDGAALVKQKAANRKTAIEGLNTMAGPLGVDRKQIIPKNEPLPSPKPGAVVDGYIFNGGNPADPKSWKKK